MKWYKTQTANYSYRLIISKLSTTRTVVTIIETMQNFCCPKKLPFVKAQSLKPLQVALFRVSTKASQDVCKTRLPSVFLCIYRTKKTTIFFFLPLLEIISPHTRADKAEHYCYHYSSSMIQRLFEILVYTIISPPVHLYYSIQVTNTNIYI